MRDPRHDRRGDRRDDGRDDGRDDAAADRHLRLAVPPRVDEPLPHALERAAHRLRADVAVSRAWRETLLHEVARAPRPRRRTVGRMPAIGAACAACLAVGVVAGRSLARAPLAAAAAHGDVAAPVVRFVLVAPGAARVSLVGDFNAWNARATPMRTSDDGRTWLVALPLAPGRHVYAFVVDGDVVADPAAPRTAGDDFGVPSSVVLVDRPSA